MKANLVTIAAVVLAVASSGAGNVMAASMEVDEAPHLRALEEAQTPPMDPSMEADAQQHPADVEGYPEAMEDPQTSEQFARWGCFPGSWNWPQCRRGGPWGCYPGSWRWPRCRVEHRCMPGSWYWPRCRSW